MKSYKRLIVIFYTIPTPFINALYGINPTESSTPAITPHPIIAQDWLDSLQIISNSLALKEVYPLSVLQQKAVQGLSRIDSIKTGILLSHHSVLEGHFLAFGEAALHAEEALNIGLKTKHSLAISKAFWAKANLTNTPLESQRLLLEKARKSLIYSASYEDYALTLLLEEGNVLRRQGKVQEAFRLLSQANGLNSKNTALKKHNGLTKHQRNLLGISLFFMALTLLIALVIRKRLKDRNLRKIKNLRQNLSADLHDDIGNTLVQINMLANLSEADSSVSPTVFQNLRLMRKKSKYAIQSMSDIVWSLDTNRNKIGDLTEKLKDCFYDTLKNSEAQKTFTTNLEGENLTLDFEKKMNFFLIAKEAFTNIAKHTTSSDIRVILEQKENLLRLSITNLIIETKENVVSTKKGKHHMRLRAAAINGTVNHFHKGNHYEVLLIVPLK